MERLITSAEQQQTEQVVKELAMLIQVSKAVRDLTTGKFRMLGDVISYADHTPINLIRRLEILVASSHPEIAQTARDMLELCLPYLVNVARTSVNLPLIQNGNE